MVKKYKIFYKNDITNLYGGSNPFDNKNLEYNYELNKIQEKKFTQLALSGEFYDDIVNFTGNVKNFEYEVIKKDDSTNNLTKLTFSYTGSVKDGDKDKGILTILKDGNFFREIDATFKSENFLIGKGIGTMTYKNGDTYEGPFSSLKKTGEGKYVKNEYTVEGVWDNNKLHEGIIEYSNGSKYEGKIKQEIEEDGPEYIKHGQGKLTDNLDNEFEGEWDNNELENGTIEYKNGNKYQGELFFSEFRDEKGNISFFLFPDEKGKMEYQNGDIFDGIWLTGDRNGEGEYEKKNEYTVTGEWYDDKWIENKEGKIIYKNGDKYEGYIKEIPIVNDDKYEGYIKEIPIVYDNIYYIYVRDGKGILTYANGNKKEGEWANDKLKQPSRPLLPENKTSTTSSSGPSPGSTSPSTSILTTSSPPPPPPKGTSPPKEIEVLIKKLLLIFEDEKTKTLVNSFNMLRMNNFIDNNLSQFLIENKITVTFNNTISLHDSCHLGYYSQ